MANAPMIEGGQRTVAMAIGPGCEVAAPVHVQITTVTEPGTSGVWSRTADHVRRELAVAFERSHTQANDAGPADFSDYRGFNRYVGDRQATAEQSASAA